MTTPAREGLPELPEGQSNVMVRARIGIEWLEPAPGYRYFTERQAEYIRESAYDAGYRAASQPTPGGGEVWDWRGGRLWLDREQWGIIADALIEHSTSALARKSANTESNSDTRAGICNSLIAKINDAALPHPQSESELSAWVSEMRTSASAEFWVCVGRKGGEYLTVRMSHLRNRSEYEAAEWNHLFGLCDKPALTDYMDATPPPPSDAAQRVQAVRVDVTDELADTVLSEFFRLGGDKEVFPPEVNRQYRIEAMKLALAVAIKDSVTDCARSHPHENMSALCREKSESARLRNELSRAHKGEGNV